MSAFDELQHQMQKAKDKVRKKVAEVVSMVSESQKKAEYELAVKQKAESMQALLADTRYADMKDFLTTMRSANQKAMEVAATQTGDAYEMSINVARYGAKIELINNILEFPGRCIAILRQTEKEAAAQK